MRIGSNKDINQENKKLPVATPGPDRAEDAAPKMDKPIKNCLTAQHEQTDNQKMFAEKHNGGKLAIKILIVRAGLIAYHFWKAR